jgi:hypothetical protein
MLHIETYTDLTPKNEPRNSVTFSAERMASIACFGNWVNCACRCGRQWNFAGGPQGLWRDGSGDGRAARTGACKAVARRECRPEMRWRYRDGAEYEDENAMKWMQNREVMQRRRILRR